MAVNHASLGLIALVFLAGSITMIFFVILAGVTTTPPLNNTYFLQADTSHIATAMPLSQWTYFYICGAGNTNCTTAHAALPFGSAWTGNATGAPAELVGDHAGGSTSDYYFYMWRFGWVLYLISLFFEVCAFLTGFLSCCGRLGSAVSGFVAVVALFFYTIAVALMTATFVKARDAFIANGQAASIGTYAFGFSWGAWAALLIAAMLFCAGFRSGRRSDRVSSSRRWRRSRSTRSRKSHELGSRRVKDEYP